MATVVSLGLSACDEAPTDPTSAHSVASTSPASVELHGVLVSFDATMIEMQHVFLEYEVATASFAHSEIRLPDVSGGRWVDPNRGADTTVNRPASLPASPRLTAVDARPTPPQQRFDVVEASIASIHDAMKAGRLTCRALVDEYLRRIEAYDKRGPTINALVVVNPKARDVADSLDTRYAAGGFVGPLHCIPTIVKDNMETTDLPTTAGSASMRGFISPKDAFFVKRIREAGAIVLAKSNMAEFAFSPLETINSILPGYTYNPYALNRVTAGSSGGTAAAVAASFGAVGLGTDTGNSIRGPSAHLSLVGIRSTMGLTSRAGIVPLSMAADIAGPMARSVSDAVAVFQVVVGEDPADSVTARGRGHVQTDYASNLKADGLKGARIGVLHQAYETQSTDSEVVAVFRAAIEDLRKAGAEIVDPAAVDSFNQLRRGGNCNQFKFDLNNYLAGLGSAVPMHSLDDIIKSGRFHSSIQQRLTSAQAVELAPKDNPGCAARDQSQERLRVAVLKLMDDQKLDALVYPTWSNPPRLIGDLSSPAGDNSQFFSPSTGFPAITVPMGFTRGGTLPAGMQFFGRPWSEPMLIKLAYAYEQATKHRKPPPTTPPIR
jgi:Asp-tRNA(Asn)/Glu-tRNA(Gln) amidotransferase A subunit family amidase